MVKRTRRIDIKNVRYLEDESKEIIELGLTKALIELNSLIHEQINREKELQELLKEHEYFIQKMKNYNNQLISYRGELRTINEKIKAIKEVANDAMVEHYMTIEQDK